MIKSNIYHQPIQENANKPTKKPAKEANIILAFKFFDSKASRNNHVITKGKNTLYASVSANPPAVLPNSAGWTATIIAAIRPPKLPDILLAMKKVGMTDRADIITGI